jgi:hypothetical protein
MDASFRLAHMSWALALTASQGLWGCAVTYDIPVPAVRQTSPIGPLQSLALALPEIVGGLNEPLTGSTGKSNLGVPIQPNDSLGTWALKVAVDELQRQGQSTGASQLVGLSVGSGCVRTTTAEPQLLAAIAAVCSESQSELILCQRLALSSGVGGGWKTITTGFGFAAFPTSVTGGVELRSVIRSCETGKEVWRGEFLLRPPPDQFENSLEQSIRRLFDTVLPQAQLGSDFSERSR